MRPELDIVCWREGKNRKVHTGLLLEADLWGWENGGEADRWKVGWGVWVGQLEGEAMRE